MLALLEAVALAVHLQDVHVVREPVQQRAGQPLRAQHLGPLGEGQVTGHQRGGPFVALAEHFKEHFGTCFGNNLISIFIPRYRIP